MFCRLDYRLKMTVVSNFAEQLQDCIYKSNIAISSNELMVLQN